MVNNLIPPFIMREAGVIIYTYKIHVDMPTKEEHSIYFKDENLCIPLSLHGVFSYFSSRLPSAQDMANAVEVFHLTPNVLTWNPHSEAYATCEDNMLDFQGSMVDIKDRVQILISDLE